MSIKYRPDHKSFLDLTRAQFIQDACQDAGERIAVTAERIDRSSRAEYASYPAGVTGGRDGTFRAGARVVDQAGTGGYDRALLAAIEVETETI